MTPKDIAANPHLATAARTLLLDSVAIECISILRGDGIRAILLKGPATADWLYTDREMRDYVDVDLMVSRDQFPAALRALGRLGYRDTQADRPRNEVPSHAHLLVLGPPGRVDPAVRFPPGTSVDLHWSFHGIGASDEEFWIEVTEGVERMRVAGSEVEVPNESIRALLLALHVATSGPLATQPLADLDRALDRVSEATWAAAYEHAVRLDAVPRFLTGLAMRPPGVQLIDRLQLQGEADTRSALYAQGIPTRCRRRRPVHSQALPGPVTRLVCSCAS